MLIQTEIGREHSRSYIIEVDKLTKAFLDGKTMLCYAVSISNYLKNEDQIILFDKKVENFDKEDFRCESFILHLRFTKVEPRLFYGCIQ